MTVSTTVNEIVNNAADRMGDVSELVAPAIETVSSISQTVVHETSIYGMCGVLIGVAILVFGIAVCAWCSRVSTKQTNEDDKAGFHVAGIVIVVVGAIIGMSVVGANIEKCVAPTKCVVYEAMKQLG